MKGFSVSGHDAVLKRVLSERFGLNVTIRGMVGGDAAPPGASAGGAPRPGGPASGGPASGGPASAARLGGLCPGGTGGRAAPAGSRTGAAGIRPAGVHRPPRWS